MFATPIRTVSALTRVQPGWQQLGLDALYGPIYHRLLAPYDNAALSDAYIETLVETVLRVWSGSRKPAGHKSKPQHAGHHDEVGRSRAMCHESRSLQQAACFCVPGMRSTARC